MDKSFEIFLTSGKYPKLWQAIAENRMEDAKKEISMHSATSKNSILALLFKNKSSKNNIALQVASTILESRPSKLLSKTKLSIKRKGNDQLAELIRLLFALQLNGHFSSETSALSGRILDLLSELAEQVRVQAGGYPNSSIEGYVWFGGCETRELCNALASYFKHLNELNSKARVLQIRTKITCSVLSHYHHFVGPDMIETAEVLEAVGETDLADKYYNAVIADFECIANEIKEYPAEEVREEQIISLSALKQAYENSNRLNNTLLHAEQLQFIDTVIEKGVTKV